LPSPPGLTAQNRPQNPPAQLQPDPQQQEQQQQDEQQRDQQQQDQQSKTFQGKIIQLQDGTYALVTGQTPEGKMSGHHLDDQDNAKKHEGKQVKVTGTLEAASNTIHVTKIEGA
jgi:hypothetical protein